MSTQEDSDEEECEFVGPWDAKGKPIGFLDSDDEEALNSAAIAEARKVKDGLGEKKWRQAAEFLLEHLTFILGEVSD